MKAVKRISSVIVAAFIATALASCAFFQQYFPELTMSDANLISVLDSINEGEIGAARLAIDKASAPEIRAFAGRILNEHRALAEANGWLAMELSLPPQPPALSSDLNRAHDETMRELRIRSGPDFDRAYVRHEIEQHMQAFDLLKAAAESATDVTLKRELIRTGPELLSHISAARALERHLGPEQRNTVASR